MGVFALAREAGVELEPGQALPWLTNRGHLSPVLQETALEDTVGLIRAIYERLGGDELALGSKRSTVERWALETGRLPASISDAATL